MKFGALLMPPTKVMQFERNYPKPLQEKILANWERWGFTNGGQ